jgi:hypothetical protein
MIGADPEHDDERANSIQPIRSHGYMRTTGSVQHEKRNGRDEGCGKDAPWKSPKADFSSSLGNPAKNAGFPLSTQPRLLLSTLCFWTQWFRPKPAKMAPFLTGVDTKASGTGVWLNPRTTPWAAAD